MNDSKKIPFWRKFQIHGFRCNGGWALRIFLGVVFLSIDWKFVYEWIPGEITSGIYLGLIPRVVLEGAVIPCKSWVRHEIVQQEAWNG